MRTLAPWLLLCCLLSGGQARAQTPEDDSPDASVGQGGGGGADRGDEEEEDGTGRTPRRCRHSSECERGFVCGDGTCKFVGYRRADRVGCLAAPPLALVLAALSVRRRFRRSPVREER